MIRTSFSGTVLTFLLAVSNPTIAGIIYDNGLPRLSGAASAAVSDAGQEVGNPSISTEAVDDFTLISNVVLRDVHWWGICDQSLNNNTCPNPLDFTIRLYNNVPNGGPGGTPDRKFPRSPR